MSSFGASVKGFKSAFDALEREFDLSEEAALGGVVAATQATVTAINRHIWVDTGDAKESAFVARDGVEQTGQVVGGWAAPYIAIVEETHPRRPHHIARTFNEFASDAARIAGETAANLYASEGGVDDVPREYPEDGLFRNTRGRT